MSDGVNIANALLILGSLYFYFTYEKSYWFIVLIIWGIGMWSFHAYTDLRKRMIQAEIELLEAKAEYYRRKASCTKR
jgi:hypothetical protein